MLLEFIAAIALGLGVAGLMVGFRFLTGQRLPGYVIPASAGLSMIAMMVYLEYGWAERTIERLPEGVTVTAKSTDQMWFRPWTYIKPLTLRIVAIDTRRNRTHENQPHQVMTTVMLLGRWMPIREIPVVYDCKSQQRADLSSEVQFGNGGELINAQWRTLPENDRALEVACAKINS